MKGQNATNNKYHIIIDKPVFSVSHITGML